MSGSFLERQEDMLPSLTCPSWPANVCKPTGQHQGHGQLVTTEQEIVHWFSPVRIIPIGLAAHALSQHSKHSYSVRTRMVSSVVATLVSWGGTALTPDLNRSASGY